MILVEEGASLSSVDVEGETLLHLAHTSIPITEFLLDHNANINAVNRRGQTPFFIAAKRRDLPSAMLLWQRGADLSIRDKNDDSAYDICERGFRNPVLEVLDAEIRLRRNEAVVMALHPRLGDRSRMGLLDPGVIREFILPHSSM